LSLCPAVLLAQAASPETAREKTAKSSHTQTVTGCLQKGDEAGEVSITGEDGKTWDCAVPPSSGSAPRPQYGHRFEKKHESKAE